MKTKSGTATIFFSTGKWGLSLFQRAPWVAVSGMFHLGILLAATVIGFRLEKPPGPGPLEFFVGSRPRTPLTFPKPPTGPDVRSQSKLPVPNPDELALDPHIHFPGATPADRNVTDDGLDKDTAKGGSLSFISIVRGSAGGPRGRDGNEPGLYDVFGVGGPPGGAGRFGTPDGGGRRNTVSTGGGTPRTEAAVLAGLRWLARHQHPDGRWSTGHFSDACGGGSRCGGPGSRDHDVGLTGLALLAFLGAGILPKSRDTVEDPFRKDPLDPGRPRTIRLGEVVLNGLRWLKDVQDPEGCFPRQENERCSSPPGPPEGAFMYDHAIATLAMAAAAWLSAAPVYRMPAQRGIDFLVQAQNPGLAWRYSVRPGDNDTSVTGWAVMALKSAELCGLQFPPACYEGARQWLRRATSARGVVGYESPGDPGSVLTGVNEKWLGHPAMTAVGLLTRIFIDRRRDPWMEMAAASIATDPPIWDPGHHTIDYYYWYYAALALFQYDGPKGKFWTAFNEKMKTALVEHQAPANRRAPACDDGSWDPAVDKWGSIGGRVYATAINVLTLEVYYRYDHVFGGRKG